MPDLAHYHRKRHRQWRAKVLRRAGGLCQECARYHRLDADGLPVQATVAHHIIPIDTRPDLAYSVTNGRALCAACHNAAHPEKGGAR